MTPSNSPNDVSESTPQQPAASPESELAPHNLTTGDAANTDRDKTLRPPPTRRNFKFWLQAYCLLACGLVVASYLSYWWEFLDALCQFRLQWVLLAIIGVPMLFVQKCHKWAAVCLIISTPTLLSTGSLFVQRSAAPTTQTEKQTYQLLVFNLWIKNRQPEEVLALVDSRDPDIICFVEYSRQLHKSLGHLEEKYPFHASDPSMWGEGVKLFSKYPLQADLDRATAPHIQGAPVVVATVSLPDQAITLVGIHTKSPITLERIRLRNQQIGSLSKIVSNLSGPVICCGDFNSTTFSRSMIEFQNQTELLDSRKGFGIQASWPANMWPLPPLIPIDHVFVSKQIQVHSRETGPPSGSDHQPVLVHFSIL